MFTRNNAVETLLSVVHYPQGRSLDLRHTALELADLTMPKKKKKIQASLSSCRCLLAFQTPNSALNSTQEKKLKDAEWVLEQINSIDFGSSADRP